ncbi:probable RNA-directed DNA polymerase from transposon X-element [Trichonephila clavipes]|nr:probable RNA-directed DNA polymerase from transposon X-element [Trichonephila clavipes]
MPPNWSGVPHTKIVKNLVHVACGILPFHLYMVRVEWPIRISKRWRLSKIQLKSLFRKSEEPYCDKIEVENLVNHFFDNFATSTPPLTSPSEVRGVIKKLQNTKAAGPDQIPNIALKYLTLNAITHLTKLYNQCLIKNHFPTQWKQANVTMLAKPNQNRTFPQGYRPISLINATAKIFERIILTRIKSHYKAIDCIPPEQCGFREGHSTLHQLIRVTNIINEGFVPTNSIQ